MRRARDGTFTAGDGRGRGRVLRRRGLPSPDPPARWVMSGARFRRPPAGLRGRAAPLPRSSRLADMDPTEEAYAAFDDVDAERPLDAFEQLVERAIEALPYPFSERLGSVAIVIEDWPRPDQLAKVGAPGLLGLYEGIPRTAWSADQIQAPSKITIFRGPLEEDLPGPRLARRGGGEHRPARGGPPLRHQRRAASRDRPLTVAPGAPTVDAAPPGSAPVDPESGRRDQRPDSARRYPKIELHVHLEGSLRPAMLLSMARRNGIPLADLSDSAVRELYAFADFPGFIAAWVRCSDAVRTGEDLRDLVVAYAAEAAAHGAVCVEAIFSPAETVRRGGDWDDLFARATDALPEAEERHGVVMRLTPDIPRGFSQEEAETTVRFAIRYRDRGVVGVGLGGLEAEYPPEPYARVFAIARDAGLGSVPHAGEVVGPASIRGALDALGAVRLRHGIRAIEDPALVRELAERRVVLDVCPTSNVFTGAVPNLAEHPLPRLMAAGVLCTINTDDPAFFHTDLANEHAAARGLGLEPRAFYDAGVAGALCDEATRGRLREIGERFDWSRVGD